MPGLFGLIKVDKETRITNSFAQKALDTMAQSLSHRSDYVWDRGFSEMHGFAIGRASHPSGDRQLWSGSHEMGTMENKTFLYGVLTKDSTDTLSQEKLNCLPSSAGKILRELQGFYSLVLIHRDFQSVVLSVDRKGSEAIFYLEQNGILFFAPEVKALLAIFDGQVELNPEAVPMFLACGHVLGDQTLVSSIKRLPGGSYLQIQANAIARKTYWAFRPGAEAGHGSEQELQTELEGILKDSVRKHLGDPTKTMIFLSGGLDSRGILAGALLAVKENGEKLNTVSWGMTDDIPSSDAMIAKRIAEEFRLHHTFSRRKVDSFAETFEETNYLTDGLSDVAAFHPYEFTIMKSIKEMGFERVLRGDETFGWHGRVYNFKEAEAEVGLRSIQNITLYSNMLRPRYFREWSDAGVSAMAHLDSEIVGMDPTDAKDYLYFRHRLQTYLFSIASYKQILFDHRNVWLDDAILDFLLLVPWKLRLHKNLYEKAASAMYPPLTAIPLADCSGLEDWDAELKKESALRRYIQKQLDDKKSGIWEYFDRNAVAALFNSLTFSPINPLSPSFRLRLRRKISRHIHSLFPIQAEKIRAMRFQSAIMPHQALLRFLVLKNWHDTFLEGKRNLHHGDPTKTS